MNIVWIIILIIWLLVWWYVGRSYYKKDTRIVSWIVVVLIAFFASRLALKLSNTELRSIRPRPSLWTGFILSSIIALISFLMGEKEEVIYRCGKAGCSCENGGVCTNTSGTSSHYANAAMWGAAWVWIAHAGATCSDGSCEVNKNTLACGCQSWACTCGTKSHATDYVAPIAAASAAGATVVSSTWADTWSDSIPAYSGTPDDLKIIEGIGPVLEWILNSHGIYTFAQIWAMAPEAVKAVLDREGDRFRTHTTESRPLQARFADAWRMKELKEMKEELDGWKFIPGGKYTAQSV